MRGEPRADSVSLDVRLANPKANFWRGGGGLGFTKERRGGGSLGRGLRGGETGKHEIVVKTSHGFTNFEVSEGSCTGSP